MGKKLCLVVCVVLLLAGTVMPSVAEQKNSGTSLLLSLLIPGAGQMYCGETSRGLTILGGEIALWALSTSTTTTTNGYYSTEETSSTGKAAAVASLGLYAWQAYDGYNAAGRANMKSGFLGFRTGLGAAPPSVSFNINPFIKSARVTKTWSF